jgi:GNAT superfamily N-acetyltransferase
MTAIQEVLAPEPSRKGMVVLRGLLPGDIGWVVQRHGARYAQEYGWDDTFEAMVARIMADYAAGHDPRREAAWIAEVDGAPVGCVMCVRDDDTTARLRVLLVEPGARGMGVGGRLVEECLRFATRAGYRRMVLLTYDALANARRIYQRAGFQLASEEKKHAYGHDLVEQVWHRDL